MKKFFIAAMIAATSLSLVVADASARRLGGGSSIGRQSQTVSRQATAPAPSQGSNTSPATAAPSTAAAPAAAPATAPVAPKPASPWKGVLGGALLGLGAGALLSHFGMGGAMGGMLGSLLMIALLGVAAMFVVRMLRRKESADSPMAPAFVSFSRNNQIVRASGMRSDNPSPRKRMNDKRSLIRNSARSSERLFVV